MTQQMTRREWLEIGVMSAAIGGPLLTSTFADSTPDSSRGTPDPKRRRVLRFAHLTDSHVQPELRAGEGLLACLRHAQDRPDPPQFLLTGGDLIMDAFSSDAARTKLQWDLFTSILKDACPLPVEHCLGNHDIWGWNRQGSRATGDEPRYGKKWAMEILGLSAPYHSFERSGWKFIVLDSVHPDGDLFRGELDAAQFDWLKDQLARTPRETPIVIVSHIPILSSTVFMAVRDAEADGKQWKIPALAMHMDARKLMTLFSGHPNVRLCLSGHIHLLDRVEYGGVTYICDGAVCGRYWEGPNQICAEGYGIIDLFDDGSFDHKYNSYGWQAVAEK